MTYNDVDHFLSVMDNEKSKLPLIKGWFPTVNELKEHDVEKNFEKYAPFLLYLSESLNNDDTYYDEKQRNQINETKKYISHLFATKTTE